MLCLQAGARVHPRRGLLGKREDAAALPSQRRLHDHDEGDADQIHAMNPIELRSATRAF